VFIGFENFPFLEKPIQAMGSGSLVMDSVDFLRKWLLVIVEQRSKLPDQVCRVFDISKSTVKNVDLHVEMSKN